MAVFLISYDLQAPGQDYSRIHGAIKQLSGGTWYKPLESAWIVPYAGHARDLRNALQPHIDQNDRLLVVELTGSWASCNLQQNIVDWLNNNLVAA